jgi:hypothetical protein
LQFHRCYKKSDVFTTNQFMCLIVIVYKLYNLKLFPYPLLCNVTKKPVVFVK